MRNEKQTKQKQKDLEVKKQKRDIRAVFSVFMLLFVTIAWRNSESLVRYVLLTVTVIMVPIIIFSPLILNPVFRLWLKLAHAIARFNTQVLLLSIYVSIFIPIGLLMRLWGRDPMRREKLVEGTYWEKYELAGVKDKRRYEKQF